MIVEAILNLVYNLLTLVFSILPDLPSFDIGVLSSVSYVINLIFNNTGLLGFFIRVSTIKLFVPLIILALTFEEVYHFAMWIITKLPIGVKSN